MSILILIYIERMSLNEKDERIAYLKYLTNLYSKNSHRINADNNLNMQVVQMIY